VTHHDYIELVRRGYEAWNRGDITAVTALAHRDFEWTNPPEIVGAHGGTGRDEFARYLRSISEVWDDFRCEPEEFRRVGDLLLVVVREGGRGKLSGAPVEHRLVHVWTFRDGKAVRLEGFVHTRDALQRLFEAHDHLPAPELTGLSAARRLCWQLV
jgi:uncharacterized protein